MYVRVVFPELVNKNIPKQINTIVNRDSNPEEPRVLALSRHELKKLAGTYIDEVYEQEDVDDAVRQAMTLADGRRDSVVMVFGSLSFIGPIIDRAEHGGYIES